MKILLITPPLLQPNTPYSATPLLTSWLRSCGHDAVQVDLSVKLLLHLFCRQGIQELCRSLEAAERGDEAAGFLEAQADYLNTVDEVIEFLRKPRAEVAERIAERGYLPEGPHLFRAYEQEEMLQWNFRGLDREDRARYLASLYLDDLTEAMGLLDPDFGFSRYAERLAVSLPEFEPLKERIERDGVVHRWLDGLVEQQLMRHNPELVALTVPFPGCLLGALRVARYIKQTQPQIPVVLGGGYVSTELRELTDVGIFSYIDALVYDSGFLPLQRLADCRPKSQWVRTACCEHGTVVHYMDSVDDPPHRTLPPPTFDGLDLTEYFGVFEVLNPVMRLWSDGRWNRLVLAQGCCWRRCAFCDTSLDYVGRYDPADAATICDWVERLIEETGSSEFHFVDEALPPTLLDPLCDEILKRGLELAWWGNIRFEKRLSPALIQKMAAAGCIAVSGGLETAHDRTLKLMKKGITVAHAEAVLRNLADAGIMSHAYLMYGFPTQTLSEIKQALEWVRGLMDEGGLHSIFWHRFALTLHSEMNMRPAQYKMVVSAPEPSRFAKNEIPFSSEFDYDPEHVGAALHTAAYNFQMGVGLDLPVETWFA